MNEATLHGETGANPALSPQPNKIPSGTQASVWDTHVRNNPMNMEATRTFRRFLAAHQKTASPKLIRFVFGMLAFLYIWMIGATIYFGEDISIMYLWIELIVLTLVAPASVYAAVSGERERLTWDSLIMTRLSPSRVLVGKMLWRVGMIASIMVLFFIPALIAHATNRKGFSDTTTQVLWQSQIMMGSWALFLLAFGLLLSAKTKRAVTTLALTGGFLFTFLALVPILYSAFGGDMNSPSPILYALFGFPAPSHGAYTSYSYETSEHWNALPSLLTPNSVIPLLGSGLVSLHPFLGLGWLENGDKAAFESVQGNLFVVSGRIQPMVFFVLAVFCMIGTFRALRRLGFPLDGLAPSASENSARRTLFGLRGLTATVSEKEAK